MAELVDAPVSGTGERMLVGVRISPSAPDTTKGSAEVVELVDTLDLGSSVERREGSSPFFGTI